MTDKPFRIGIPPAELEEILLRIDENLAFRQLIRPAEDTRTVAPTWQLPAPPGQPDLALLDVAASRIGIVAGIGAPLFRPAPGFAGTHRRWLTPAYFILNLPLRLWGRRQMGFNAEVLQISQSIASSVRSLAIYAIQLGEALEGVKRILPHLIMDAPSLSAEDRIRDLEVRQSKLESELIELRRALSEHRGGHQVEGGSGAAETASRHS